MHQADAHPCVSIVEPHYQQQKTHTHTCRSGGSHAIDVIISSAAFAIIFINVVKHVLQ